MLTEIPLLDSILFNMVLFSGAFIKSWSINVEPLAIENIMGFEEQAKFSTRKETGIEHKN